MARPLTRNQIVQNRAFLEALAQSGNVRLAARAAGVAYATMQYRRKVHPQFAAAFDRTMAFARAQVAEAAAGRRALPAPDPAHAARHRTRGGEPVLVRLRGGQVQLRRGQPGKLAPGAIATFLAALAATCNVRLAAAAAGTTVQSLYRRKQRDPGFAREWRMALERGWEALDEALVAGFLPEAFAHDDWRRNEVPPIPPMQVREALKLMAMHLREARLESIPDSIRRRRGESEDIYAMRLGIMREAREQRERDKFLIAEAERRARGEPWVTGPKELPDLSHIDWGSEAKPDGADYAPVRGRWRGRWVKAGE